MTNKRLQFYRICSHLIIIGIAGAIFYYGTPLSSNDCNGFYSSPNVSIKLIALEPKMNSSLSKKQIGDIRAKAHDVHKKNMTWYSRVAGLAVTNPRISISRNYKSRLLGFSGTACYAPIEVNITLYLDQTVYVNKDSYADQCQFDAVFDHEVRHLRATRDVLEASMPVFEKNLKSAVLHFHDKYGVGPYELTYKTSLFKTFDEYVSSSVQIAMHETAKAIDAKQSLIDSPKEYARIRRLCRW